MRLLDGADVFVENLNPGKLKRRDLDPAQAPDRLGVGAVDLRWLGRPRRQHDRTHVEARGARRLDGEQRVVDRPQPGARGDNQRPPEVQREVADRGIEHDAKFSVERPPDDSAPGRRFVTAERNWASR